MASRRRLGRSSLQRYLGESEQVLLLTRQHPFALVRAAFETLTILAPLLLVAWGVSGTVLLRGAPGTWLLRATFLLMLLVVARLAWRVLGWEFERVVVTNEKVIHVRGVLDRRIASTPLAKASEFAVHQPLLGRVFDYGSLVVDVPGGREQALHGLSCLPDPAGLYRLVSGQARRGRMDEGGGTVAAGPPAPVVVPVSGMAVADPWDRVPADALDGPAADHTIVIPRVTPPPGAS